MITKLKPYPVYKDSGVEWLGKVPGHWEVRRLKSTSHIIMGQSPPSDDCSAEPFGLPFLQGCAEFGQIHPRAKQFCRHPVKVCPVGAVLVSVRAPVGRLNLADKKYVIGRGLCAIVPMKGLLNKTFVQFAISASVDRLAMSSTGSTFDAVSVSDIGNHTFPLPPLPEQTAIVRFLDWAERRIQRVIRARKRRIQLLEEYKQALIHQAVTGQIDVLTGKPYPAYKDSGVEWLGQVPKHWEVKPIRALAKPGYKCFVDGDWIESPFIRDEGIRLIQTGNIGVGEYKEQGFRYIDEKTFREFKCTEVLPGDVLICRLADPVGRACLAPDLGCRMITSVDVCILKPHKDTDASFTVYNLSGPAYLSWLAGICRGGTRDRVSRSMLGSIRVQVPPLKEQRAIAEYLDTQTAKIDTAMAADRRAIELLQEFRTRLIADVVTGKVDVREVAAQLPEEAEELEAVDEAEALPEDEAGEEGLDEDALAEEVES